jgi:N-acetylmuramoyl-L-alanine amidase
MLATAVALAASQQPAPQPPPTPQPAPAQPPQIGVFPIPQRGLTTVVLDAAHGGADPGARGSNGIVEKDVTLALARAVKAQLEAGGLRVVLTRDADQNPSLDDRSAVANAREGAVLISLHVGSAGAPGTARAYFFPPENAASTTPAAPLLRWEEAQSRYAELSRQLAALVQVQIAQKLRGSLELPAPASVRQLRTTAAPAIAIEVASVSVKDRKPLDAAAAPLADAVAHAVLAFRPVYAGGQ